MMNDLDTPGMEHMRYGYECKNEFKFVINIANLKLLPGDYFVSISSKLISNWSNVSRSTPVNYFIALEKTSEFNV